jgi:hypothetical protein
MAEGWECENCGEFHLDVHAVSKITVSIEPRDFEAAVTLCSLRCLDEYRPQLDDVEAAAAEHRTSPRLVRRVSEENA